MYDCGQDVIDLFNRNYRQIVRVHFAGGGRVFDITEQDIVQGGFTIDRYCVSGSKIEVGSAIAAELSVKLKNYDGRFDEIPFEGADLFVQVGIKKWDAGRWENAVTHWVPCGHFIIDTPPRTLSTISISALDRMVKFDREVDISRLHFPVHVDELLDDICAICGVSLLTDVSLLPNHQYSVGSVPSADNAVITYRQLLQWCAGITGTCAFMDANGRLVLKWYEQTGIKITPSERYSSDMYENDITVTGFTCTDTAGNTYTAGSTAYALDLSSCALLRNSYQGVLTALYNARKNFTYRPYQAVIKSAPYLYPLDRIYYTDAKGVVHDTIVTNVTFTLNNNTSIAGSGETVTNASYAGSSGMTVQQSAVIAGVQNRVELVMSEQTLSARDLSQLTVNALGLNATILASGDGVMSYYFHDGKTLADSSIIYTLLGGTFAWTTDYNDGNPIWCYGYTQESSMILRSLLLYQITSEYIADGSITENSLDPEYLSKVNTAITRALAAANQYTDEGIDAVKDYADTQAANVLSRAKEYADTQDTSVLKSANRYTDEGIDTAKGYSDNLLNSAKKYADIQLAAAKEYSDDLLDTAKKYSDDGMDAAKLYADGLHRDGKLYTDTSVKALSESVGQTIEDVCRSTAVLVQQAISEANSYTDEQTSAAVQEASRLALLLYMQGSDGTLYKGTLRCLDGKPQFVYERTE